MRTRFASGCLLTVLWVFLISGCASTTTPHLTRETSFGTKFTAETIAQIKEGSTKKDEVQKLLGSPFSSTLTGEGKEMWFYSYYLHRMPLTQTYRLDPETGPVIVDKRNPEMVMQTTQILFSKEGIVEKIIHSSSGTEIKSKVVAE